MSSQDQRTPEKRAEDHKAAVSMWVTLSSQVIAATLALIAVEGAFTTFVLDKRLPPFWFYLFVVGTVLLFIISILNGGAGINRLTREGNNGNWNLNVGTPYFQRQTIICLAGVVLFFVSLFSSGPSKEDTQGKELKALQETVQTQQSKINTISSEAEKLRNEVISLRDELKRASKEDTQSNKSDTISKPAPTPSP